MTQITTNNLETAKHCYDLFAKGDIDTLVNDFLAPNVVWVEPDVAGLPISGTQNGPQEVATNVFAKTPEVFGDTFRINATNWIAEGEWVVMNGTVTGTVEATGNSVELPTCHVMQIRDGRLVRFQNHTDTATMLQAL